MTDTSDRFPATAAGRASAWLWETIRLGGEGVTSADLDSRFGPSFREERDDYKDVARFRQHTQGPIWSSAELVEAVSETDHVVTVVFDAGSTRLEATVEVDDQPPYPIKDIRLRLEGGASMTAVDVAAARAFHYLAHPDWRVLDDEFAVILLAEFAEHLKKVAQAPLGHPFPINTPARHRYAEDRLLESLEEGVDQYLLLGAGLDTSPLRHRDALAGCRVFELDHPKSQGWKLRRFSAVGLSVPKNVALVPADLSVDDLEVVLRAAGFDPARPSFVSWLGVTYYLPIDAVQKTLKTMGSWAPRTHLVFDYFLPPDTWPPEMHLQAKDYAGFGEPWVTWWADIEVERMLSRCGLETVELVDTAGIIERYAPDVPIELDRRAVQHIAHAKVS